MTGLQRRTLDILEPNRLPIGHRFRALLGQLQESACERRTQFPECGWNLALSNVEAALKETQSIACASNNMDDAKSYVRGAQFLAAAEAWEFQLAIAQCPVTMTHADCPGQPRRCSL